MLITINLEHPDNDVEVVGLREGETLEARLGPKGYAAYRIFGASARLLFLSLQKLDKPDIADATAMMLERESMFIRQRLDELARMNRGGTAQPQAPRAPQRPPDRRNGRDRGRH